MQIALTDFHLTVCCYVTYRFKSESTLQSLSECQETPCSKQALHLKLSDSSRTQTHHHLVHKQTLNNLAKLTLMQFKGHGSGRKHGNQANNPIFFHLLFTLKFLVTSISEFVNTQNSRHFWFILACKIPQFLARSDQFGQLIILFQKVRHTEATKNLYYTLCTCHSQILIFQAPTNGLNIVVQKRTPKHSSPH